ncbi:hypothetical protein [Oceanicoccus sp. KOV_DT_Chl]|uniref:hypothetical protein n=1 Tax=Oceanicoccus sp. KOV_DT_Chl TaxID=1904639 RepID=UPI0011AF0438|nr:hypothetical protein [Oceanicoccus sp. KOV_DT_Chl]
MKGLFSNTNILSSYFQPPMSETAINHLSIIEANVPGNQTIVRDKQNGLEWLNLRATMGKSSEQVRQLCKPGGELQGWWYASLTEAQQLFDQFGFDPDIRVSSNLTPQIKDCIETMNHYLGETIHFSGSFPHIHYSGSIVLTGTSDHKNQLITLPAFYQQHSDNFTLDLTGNFSIGSQYVPPYLSSLLVRYSPKNH